MENDADDQSVPAHDLITGDNAASLAQNESIVHQQLSAAVEIGPQPFENVHAIQDEGGQFNSSNEPEDLLQEIPFEYYGEPPMPAVDIVSSATNEVLYLLETSEVTMGRLVDQLLETMAELQDLRDQIFYMVDEAIRAAAVPIQMHSERNYGDQEQNNEQINESQVGSPNARELHEGQAIDAGGNSADTEDEACMIDELYQMCQRELANASTRTIRDNGNAVMSAGEASIALTSSIQNEEAGEVYIDELDEATVIFQNDMNRQNDNAQQNDLQVRPPLTEMEMIDEYLQGNLRP